MNFKEIPYWERSLFMAKLYNHAWYDNSRFDTLAKLLEEWEKNPSKEVKFLQESDTFNFKNQQNGNETGIC